MIDEIFSQLHRLYSAYREDGGIGNIDHTVIRTEDG